ncbi:tRNA-specific adenosine-34 deaminase [Mycetocola reblochoni REB411]|uniref:tRNA-specific adenosine deaminase n=1 Tax=Mycetocola reblochoni REB411 TaxID=1255698 RepID=A0A1R4IX67_9MICO|nr:tRNA-specific adenosine-34 deaminase [Mycetocola reblochoni REB411]
MDLPHRVEHEQWMRVALAEAAAAAERGEVPVGAVVVGADGEELARAGNEREASGDPTAHAEVLAIRRAAARTGDRHLIGCTLVVTLEPCVMCAGAILAAHVPTVVFGGWDEKAGAGGSRHDLLRDRTLPQRCEVVAGVLPEASAELLREFFLLRRRPRRSE